MSADKFIPVLERINDDSNFRNELSDPNGSIKLYDGYGLTTNEVLLLFLCGVHCGHVNVDGGAPDRSQSGRRNKFKNILKQLIEDKPPPQSGQPRFREAVRSGGKRLDNASDPDVGNNAQDKAQIELLYAVGLACGHTY